ncbi:MAG TPA: transketolase C-terminal domain-containing protein [Dehalococcoidales bacterium]|nr:transketolase C-terminal domain-containing protein [Dehalococcoidales bacterium]
MKKITYMQASAEALREEFQRDDRIVLMATDIAMELRKEFGEERVRQTPISESAMVGAAIGLAGSGYRAIADIRMATFGFVAMDQMVNQAAKITYMFGGQTRFPILIRMSIGAGMSFAAQHSISPYSMYMNVPGLKIIVPSTPYDIKGLLKAALRDNNPVISFEHGLLGPVVGEVPDEEYTVPFGRADIKREGTDITVVAISRMVHEALAAAEEMESRGISCEVIDPRTLVPLDVETIRSSVRRTGRLVVVDEACRTCSAASEIISLVVENDDVFGKLKSPPGRVCGLDVPIPYSPPMENYALPNREKIGAAVRQSVRK